MAPIKSTWAFCQTRFEKSGANGEKICIIVAGRVRNRSPLFERTGDESVPYPFGSQMAKVEPPGTGKDQTRAATQCLGSRLPNLAHQVGQGPKS